MYILSQNPNYKPSYMEDDFNNGYKRETHAQTKKPPSISNKLISCHCSLPQYLCVVRVFEEHLK